MRYLIPASTGKGVHLELVSVDEGLGCDDDARSEHAHHYAGLGTEGDPGPCPEPGARDHRPFQRDVDHAQTRRHPFEQPKRVLAQDHGSASSHSAGLKPISS